MNILDFHCFCCAGGKLKKFYDTNKHLWTGNDKRVRGKEESQRNERIIKMIEVNAPEEERNNKIFLLDRLFLLSFYWAIEKREKEICCTHVWMHRLTQGCINVNTNKLFVCFCQSFSRRWSQKLTAPRSCVFMSSRIPGISRAAFRPSLRPLLNMLKVSVYLHHTLKQSSITVLTVSRVTFSVYHRRANQAGDVTCIKSLRSQMCLIIFIGHNNTFYCSSVTTGSP